VGQAFLPAFLPALFGRQAGKPAGKPAPRSSARLTYFSRPLCYAWLSIELKPNSPEIAMLLHALIATLALTAGFAEDDSATLIVGSWSTSLTEEGVTSKITMTFTKDGKAKVVIDAGDNKGLTIEGTYKVEKNKLVLTRTVNGKDETDSPTIKELTKEKLVLLDSKDQKELAFTRNK